MRYLTSILFIFLLAGAASCTKKPAANPGTASTTDVVLSGTLQKQGATTYQYGTHVLVASPTLSYVLKSSTIDLDPYVGTQVMVTATNTHYTAENGPELFDVTYIKW